MGQTIEDFESGLQKLSQKTRLPLQRLPVILGDIAGVLMQEARETLFEDREEVVFDAISIREELVRMGHDRHELGVDRVKLLLDFFVHQVMDPQSTRN